MAHVFEKEIQALLRGESLQFDSRLAPKGAPENWIDFVPGEHASVSAHLISGTENTYRFRLKPRTVKIGNREVEAPVLERVINQKLWTTDSDGTPKSLEPYVDSYVKEVVASGRAYASRDAALAAHDAITALLRGESC